MPEDAGDAPGLWSAASILTRLLLMSVALRAVGFKRLYVKLSRKAGRIAARRAGAARRGDNQADRNDGAADALNEARECAAMVTLVNRRYSPLEAGCLVESLALWWTLRKRGIEADLRLGVRTLVGPLQSHAWVEYRGAPLNDSQEVGQIFEPFDLNEISSDLKLP